MSTQSKPEPEDMVELHYLLCDCERCKEARKPKESNPK